MIQQPSSHSSGHISPTAEMVIASITQTARFFTLFIFFTFTVSSSPNPESFDFNDEEDVIAWLKEEEDVSEANNMVRQKSEELYQSNNETCDFSKGKWVYDESYPLYDGNCPYLSTAVSCRKNGRPDHEYEKWRWNPSGCSLPRFDALDFLGKMREKRIMLVGDSIMRNQWESLVCLVQGVIPTGRKSVTYHGPTMSFHALDFGMSIEFCWSPLLVDLRRDIHNKMVVQLDSVEANAQYWRSGVDVLLFGSAHWWTHSIGMNSWDYYMEGNRVYKDLNPMVAYQKGLTTWAKWVDLNLDPLKTRVIFRTNSPSHNRQNGWRCYKQRVPLEQITHPHLAKPNVVATEVILRMRFPVYLQDITDMSALRLDGHPSVYRSRSHDNLGQEENHHGVSDCSHWCLPGVPDTWNEILNVVL